MKLKENLKKSRLGQFYTTNSKYIIGDFISSIPKGSTVVDPFAGNWDLLRLIDENKEAYDLDPKNKYTEKRDTLLFPLNYKGKWIATNPPYLARNKSKDKIIFDKYQTDDLYKAALISMIGCDGGIIIIPVNFFSSEDDEIRKNFLSKYKILNVKVFEEQVFEDTTYTVCSFFFIKEDNKEQIINFEFYPDKEKLSIKLEYDSGYRIGYDIYHLEQSRVKVSRLLIGGSPNSNILLRAIDTGSKDGDIKLLIDKPFYGKNTDRAFATLVFSKKFSIEEQNLIVEEFNKRIDLYRKKYKSMFLTNYRNSTEHLARKRIGFNLAYSMVSHIILEFGLDSY
jgi:hypothetical protein